MKRPLVIATLASAIGIATLSTQAAAGDPLLGALLGGGIGAAIGHDVNGRHGAAVGGVLGAIVGSSLAADSGPYYGDPYYAPAPVYYGPPPVYYGPSVVYRSRPVYVHDYHPRYYARHDARGDRDHRDWRHR